MPVNRQPMENQTAEDSVSLQWANDVEGRINEHISAISDLEDGKILAEHLEVKTGAGEEDAGDRGVIFHLTDTLSRIIRWVHADLRFALLDQASCAWR
jgi:hypothetical protein